MAVCAFVIFFKAVFGTSSGFASFEFDSRVFAGHIVSANFAKIVIALYVSGGFGSVAVFGVLASSLMRSSVYRFPFAPVMSGFRYNEVFSGSINVVFAFFYESKTAVRTDVMSFDARFYAGSGYLSDFFTISVSVIACNIDLS